MAYLGCHMYNDENEDIIKPATDVFEINDFTGLDVAVAVVWIQPNIYKV